MKNNSLVAIIMVILIGALLYVGINFNKIMGNNNLPIDNTNNEETNTDKPTNPNSSSTSNNPGTPSNSNNTNTPSNPNNSNNTSNLTGTSNSGSTNNPGNTNNTDNSNNPGTTNNTNNTNNSNTTNNSDPTRVTSREDQICESVKNNGSIDYASFKELSNQKNSDDYYAIKAAHNCANKYNLPVVVTKGTYNIYKNKTGGNEQDRIIVQTSTDLGGSTIYIHDEKNVISVNRVGKDYIYEIPGNYADGYTVTLTEELKKGGNFVIPNTTKQKALNLVKGCENVNISDATKVSNCITGFYVYIEDLDTNRRIFKRSTESQTSPVEESFTVNLNNKINEDIQWKYNGRKVKVIVSAIPTNQLIFQNGIFKTIVSSSDVADYEVKRGIKISRSNIRVTGIKHSYVNTKREDVHTTYYQYHNFYRFDMLAKVNFYGSTVQGMWRLKPNDSSHYGSYDIHMTNVVNMKLTKIKVSDTTSSMTKDYKIIGGSYNKNITYDSCILNRIDTHRGVYNLTITNSTIGTRGNTQIGYGTLTLENVTVEHNNAFITLRHDYGSTWNGTVVIKGTLTIKPDNNNPIYLIKAQPKCNHDYGYNLYLPKVEFTSGSKIVTTSKTNEFYIYDKPKQWLNNYKAGGGNKLKYPSSSDSTSFLFSNAKFENGNGKKVSIDKSMIFSKTSDVKDCNGNKYK